MGTAVLKDPRGQPESQETEGPESLAERGPLGDVKVH